MSRALHSKIRATTHPPRPRPILIFDTETTGLSPTKNNLIEIAIHPLLITTPHPPLSFSSLIHPPTFPPRSTSRIHGITNPMMQDAPPFSAVWPCVLEYIDNFTKQGHKPLLVAHNLNFDISFLRAECARNGFTFPNWDFACSLRDVAHVVFPGEKASLKALTERFQVVNEEAHRALCDVEATGKVLAKVDDVLRERAVKNGQSARKSGDYIREMLENAARKRAGETQDLPKVPPAIYVAQTGILWHAKRECELLDLAYVIRRVDDVPAGKMPCFKCAREFGKDVVAAGKEGTPSVVSGDGNPTEVKVAGKQPMLSKGKPDETPQEDSKKQEREIDSKQNKAEMTTDSAGKTTKTTDSLDKTAKSSTKTTKSPGKSGGIGKKKPPGKPTRVSPRQKR